MSTPVVHVNGDNMSITHAPDNLVTEEMVHAAAECIDHPSVYMGGPREQSKRTAARILRAVAPMIAARADQPLVQIERQAIRRAERERCAKIAEEHCTSDLVALVCGFIAAAIRARGETE
jgi:hypothetical protein